jgi:peptidoglycan/LPS O-acetylase OafA/YrhL
VVRLEQVLGTLPADWPRRTVDELAAQHRRRGTLLARVETPLLLRAVAITLIVGSHVELWSVMGGAHALLVLFGYNLARFALQAPTSGQRIRALGRTLRELVVPATLWIGGVALTTDLYRWPTALFLNGLLGRRSWTEQWQFWFLETAVWTTAALAILLLMAPVGGALLRWPLGVPLVVLVSTLALRTSTSNDNHVVATYSVAATAWCVVLGWAAASARGTGRRLLVSALVPVCTHGFFGPDHLRELVVVLGALMIIWLPRILLVRPLDRAVSWLGGASLFVYLSHWVVYPHLEQDHRVLAWLASITAGIFLWRAYTALRRCARPARRPAYCSTTPCSRTGSDSMP